MIKKLHCSGTIYYGQEECHNYPCDQEPTIGRNGQWYCAEHDPKMQEECQNENIRRWSHEAELNEARIIATKDLSLEELQKVTPDLIRNIINRKDNINAKN